MNSPATPLSEQAASDVSRNIGAHGGDLAKFFSGMMANGGQQNLDQILADMNTQFRNTQQQSINDVKASGIPLASSGMARLMGDTLGKANVDYNVNRGQIQLNEMNNVFQRMFGGAQGLQGLNDFYSAPTSIEAAMFGMRQPYDMARINGLSNAYSQLFNQNYYQPDRVEGPSGYQKYVAPFVNPILQGFGRAAGAAMLG